ncbi:glycosyltransferase 87 family protein [Streptomyces albiaxialis]|uniref:glycosyltransferase 87 family protein n=1 Tax=Streptomyces albiaxialis TaxID=329523 RepID=UPI0031D7DE1B
MSDSSHSNDSSESPDRTPWKPVLLHAAFAAFAGLTALVTSLPPHRVWGTFAACAYGAAALVLALAPRVPRRAVAAGVFGGAALLPLAVLAATGSAQEEVGVVQRAGARLLAHGTPYLGPDELAGEEYGAYNPYLPGMALFGVPHRLLGVDARWAFALVALAALAVALRAGAGARSGAFALLAGSPLLAQPLVTGGDDLPVVGLVCLGLALAGRDRAARAGLVLALAGTLKATAWPALVVGLVLVAARGGPRAALRYGTRVVPVLAAGVLLPALADPGGFVANTVRYPLGLADAASPAAAPLPGTFLAGLGPYGHATAVALLAAAALAVGGSLVVRPPRDARAAQLRLALGLLAAMTLMPASRFGYLAYPAVLALCARCDLWRNDHAPHTDRHERLPAAPGRHRDIRARDGAPVPAG